ncbi:MAG: hypothetical protein ABSH05_08690 [Bryobacteraceae bacterium]
MLIAPLWYKRAREVLGWALPPLFLAGLYWLGLKAWFQLDDFPWIGLAREVHSGPGLIQALFQPMAQGTIRPLSERAFFLVFYNAFGLDALPYRILVFLTQFANLVLLGWVARRLTRSSWAGFLTPLLWAANSALVAPMCWTSAYNQVLCGFFLLLAFHCHLKYIETTRRRYLLAEWFAFLLGFGALELMLVYPALRAAHALCGNRKQLRGTIPMALVSTAYLAVHWWISPVPPAGSPYAFHIGPSIFGTLWRYWEWSLGPSRLAQFIPAPEWAGAAGTAVLTLALAGFVVARIRSRQWLVLFPAAWFLVLLAPVLPLRDHMSDHYLTLPAMGLALAGAWGLVWGWSRCAGQTRAARIVWRGAALALLALYLFPNLVEVRLAVRETVRRSWGIRTLVLGVARIRQLHPDKTIVLAHLPSDVFWTGVFFLPFRALGISGVYLAPEAEREIGRHPEFGRVADFVIPADVLTTALLRGQAYIYQLDGNRMRAVTRSYMAARGSWKAQEPRLVDVGDEAFAAQLGPAWYAIENGHRWMPGRATVWLGGPTAKDQRLYLSGWCPAAQVVQGPLAVRIAVEGQTLATMSIPQGGDSMIDWKLPLPETALGKLRIEVAIEVERTFTPPPDTRKLGLVFGRFEIR